MTSTHDCRQVVRTLPGHRQRTDFNEFIHLCKLSAKEWGNSLGYMLMEGREGWGFQQCNHRIVDCLVLLIPTFGDNHSFSSNGQAILDEFFVTPNLF
jgi:hypothetical protein